MKQFAMMALAKKVIDLRRAGGKVPENVMAAARKILEKKGSQTDQESVLKYINISHDGTRQFKQDLRGLQAPVDIANKYAVLASSAAQGGIGGMASSVKIATEFAKDAQVLTQQKWFREAVEGAAAKWLKDPAKGTQFYYGLARAARIGGAALGTVAVAAGIYKGIVSTGEALGGLGNLEARRLAYSQHAIDALNPRRTALEKQISDLRLEHSENRATGAGALPIIGDLVATFKDTVSAAQLGRMETEQALRKARIGGNVTVSSLRSDARESFYAQSYGSFFGRLVAGLDTFSKKIGFSGKAGEEGTTAEAQKKLTRAQALKAAGWEAIGQGNFDAGREFMKQANQEVAGAAPAWKNVESAYPAMLMAADSRIGWPFSQMPRHSRTGE